MFIIKCELNDCKLEWETQHMTWLLPWEKQFDRQKEYLFSPKKDDKSQKFIVT
jgi:hypothetical protein